MALQGLRDLGRFLACCVFGLTAIAVYEVDGQINVTVADSSTGILAQIGTNQLQLSCNANRLSPGSPIILTHRIEWWKDSREPEMGNQSMKLSEMGVVVAPVDDPDHYSIEADVGKPNLPVRLYINTVNEKDDGRYFCRVVSNQNGNMIVQASVDLIVPSNDEKVQLMLDNTVIANVNMTSSSTTKVAAGSHVVSCLANGINPKQKMVMTLGDRQLDGSEEVLFMRTVSQRIGAPRYSVDKRAAVELLKSDDGKRLTCRPENSTTASRVLRLVDPPVISCNDVRVPLTQRHVTLTCLVRHPDVVRVSGQNWDLGNVIANSSSDSKPTIQTVSQLQTRLTLTLHVANWIEGNATSFNVYVTAITDVGDFSQTLRLTIGSDDDDTGNGGAAARSQAFALLQGILCAFFFLLMP